MKKRVAFYGCIFLGTCCITGPRLQGTLPNGTRRLNLRRHQVSNHTCIILWEKKMCSYGLLKRGLLFHQIEGSLSQSLVPSVVYYVHLSPLSLNDFHCVHHVTKGGHFQRTYKTICIIFTTGIKILIHEILPRSFHCTQERSLITYSSKKTYKYKCFA